MRRTYENFLRLYAENKPYEDAAVERAVQFFSQNREIPFEVTKVQDNMNYKTSHYDAELKSGAETVKVEVKTDHRSKETGNFFIEYMQYGKPSGIDITEADVYVISDTERYYSIPVVDLRGMIEYLAGRGELREGQLKSDDGLWTLGFLLPKRLALRFATELP